MTRLPLCQRVLGTLPVYRMVPADAQIAEYLLTDTPPIMIVATDEDSRGPVEARRIDNDLKVAKPICKFGSNY